MSAIFKWIWLKLLQNVYFVFVKMEFLKKFFTLILFSRFICVKKSVILQFLAFLLENNNKVLKKSNYIFLF